MIHKSLKAWLNGTRDYKMGVALFRLCNLNAKLADRFDSGYSLWNYYKLQELLTLEYRNSLQDPVITAVENAGKLIVKLKDISRDISKNKASDAAIKKIPEFSNEILIAIKKEADFLYKEAMNARATLFHSIPDISVVDGNRQEEIEFRQPLALEGLKKYLNASEVYDRLEEVKNNGLPADVNNNDVVDNIPDHEVGRALDNARKAMNKLLRKEQTPERILRINKHKSNIEKLVERWDSLRSI